MSLYYILLYILLCVLIPLFILRITNITHIKKENYNINEQIIPKYIFQTITDKKDLNDDVLKNIDNLRKKNPTYKYFLFDDNECIDFIKNNYDKDTLDTYMLINHKYGPAKADLFRYLLLYKYGGIYLDIKSSCDLPFSEIIKSNDKYILCHWSEKGHGSSEHLNNNFYGEFQQWNIICVPNHPFLKNVIDKVIYNIKNYDIKKDGVGKLMVLNITGPFAYTRAITPILNKYGHTLYKCHKKIKLVYKTFNHLTYFGNKHYSNCTESLIKI
jgi:mannosyltransferase OCH1-like enzyme